MDQLNVLLFVLLVSSQFATGYGHKSSIASEVDDNSSIDNLNFQLNPADDSSQPVATVVFSNATAANESKVSKSGKCGTSKHNPTKFYPFQAGLAARMSLLVLFRY